MQFAVNMKKIFIKLMPITLTTTPFVVFAFERTAKGIADWLIKLIFGPLMPLLFSAALALFIWGVVEFIRSADNSEARKRGKKRILWGIIALFLMVTFLAITNIFTRTLFEDRAFLPQLHTNN